MTAVGVARPRAQGHAMASTLRAHLKTNCKRISVEVNPSLSAWLTGRYAMFMEPTTDHTTRVKRDRKTTVGTKYLKWRFERSMVSESGEIIQKVNT